jgi:DNA-binding LytR/AlgR family response regulator
LRWEDDGGTIAFFAKGICPPNWGEAKPEKVYLPGMQQGDILHGKIRSMPTVKIGVVEDEMIIAATIESTLKKLKYEVAKTASNYDAALGMIEREQPDVLLLDINLGGKKDGIDIAHVVRENYSIPIVFLTANSDPDTIDRAKAVNPNAYLVKPFSQEDLYTAIEIGISNFNLINASVVKLPHAIMLKVGYEYVQVVLNQLIYVKSNENYIKLHLQNDKSLVIRSTISEMAERLPEAHFSRIGRSVIINHSYITKMDGQQVFLEDISFPITAISHKELLDKLG